MRFSNSRGLKTGWQCGCKATAGSSLKQDKVYTHYNNGVYMGGMECFKRKGKGILLLDDGICCLCQYCHDTMAGHNIIYRKDMVISIIISKTGNTQIAIRKGSSVFKFNVCSTRDSPEGQATMIDFDTKKLYYLVYQGEHIVRKVVQSNDKILKQVFVKQLLQKVMDRRHADALTLQSNHSSVIRCKRRDDKFVLGFISPYGYLDGLGFKIEVGGADKLDLPFKLRYTERGHYSRGRLQNFGERTFSNSNIYIGEFEDDCFQGKGLLQYPDGSKWVFGEFEGERLVKMLDMGGELKEERSLKEKKTSGYLRDIHAYNDPNSFIGNTVNLPSWRRILARMEEASAVRVTDVAVEKERQRQEEFQRLNLIQQHFSSHSHGKEVDLVINEQFQKEYQTPETITFQSPEYIQIIRIRPRNRENEEYWQTCPEVESTPPKRQFNLDTFKNRMRTPRHILPPEEDHFYSSRSNRSLQKMAQTQ